MRQAADQPIRQALSEYSRRPADPSRKALGIAAGGSRSFAPRAFKTPQFAGEHTARDHPFPSRTRKLSLAGPMVLHGRLCGRLGDRRQYLQAKSHALRAWLFCVCGLFCIFGSPPWFGSFRTQYSVCLPMWGNQAIHFLCVEFSLAAGSTQLTHHGMGSCYGVIRFCALSGGLWCRKTETHCQMDAL